MNRKYLPVRICLFQSDIYDAIYLFDIKQVGYISAVLWFYSQEMVLYYFTAVPTYCIS